MMKRYVFFLFLFSTLVSMLYATDEYPQRLSPAEFRAKQQEFMISDAGLTPEEAAMFFPVYFELQDKKKNLSDRAWQLVHQGNNDNLSESQYKNILEGVYNYRIAIDRLEKSYFYRFRSILSYKKILRINRAEMRFNRQLVRGMRGRGQEFRPPHN
jgi:hypothetical protein